MKTEWSLTQEAFDTMLNWLDPSREQAGRKYETIRSRLIMVFARRGCPIPEELTDETFNRVARRVQDVSVSYVGDPALYFYGVAQKVHLEYVRKKPVSKPLPAPDPAEDVERNLTCLEQCMDNLDSESRQLILEYYQEEKRAKIDHRRQLAARLGLGAQALRMRASRIRAALQSCVADCLQIATTKQ